MIAPKLRAATACLIATLALAACGNFGGGETQFGTAPPPPAAAPGQAQSYTVVAGDTVDGVAHQFDIPVETLIQANHLAYPYVLQTGQTLTIPGRGTALVAPPADYVVARGDTLIRIARQHGTTVAALASLNGLSAPYTIKVGQHLMLTSPQTAAATSGDGAPVDVGPATPAPSVPPASTGKVATEALPLLPGTSVAPAPASTQSPPPAASAPPPAVAPGNSSQVATVPPPMLEPVKPASPPPSTASGTSGGTSTPPPATPPAGSGASTASVAPSAGGSSSAPLEPPPQAPAEVPEPAPRGSGKFLWPVNGKVVSPYGVKEGGLHNDGINIAAPLGTPVRAADNGVVVYAGNELRGFGNLLLVRHADGWVSAYAHCEALLVKRGDQVKRGQVIARVGETGAVSSPQLHFELRKSGQVVDPMAELGPQGA